MKRFLLAAACAASPLATQADTVTVNLDIGPVTVTAGSSTARIQAVPLALASLWGASGPNSGSDPSRGGVPTAVEARQAAIAENQGRLEEAVALLDGVPTDDPGVFELIGRGFLAILTRGVSETDRLRRDAQQTLLDLGFQQEKDADEAGDDRPEGPPRNIFATTAFVPLFDPEQHGTLTGVQLDYEASEAVTVEMLSDVQTGFDNLQAVFDFQRTTFGFWGDLPIMVLERNYQAQCETTLPGTRCTVSEQFADGVDRTFFGDGALLDAFQVGSFDAPPMLDPFLSGALIRSLGAGYPDLGPRPFPRTRDGRYIEAQMTFIDIVMAAENSDVAIAAASFEQAVGPRFELTYLTGPPITRPVPLPGDGGVAPVPLPAGVWGLAAALASMALWGRRVRVAGRRP